MVALRDPHPRTAALIVAAGRGERAGSGIPKQYRALAGRPLLTRAIEALAADPRVQSILCVIGEGQHALYRDAIGALPEAVSGRLFDPVEGATTRQGSVCAGLEALDRSGLAPDIVLVHDAARPLVRPDLVARAIDSARRHGAAIPGVPLTDTVKLVDAESVVAATPDRARLRAVQTPQAFAFPVLLSAHRRARDGRVDGLTDDAAVIEWTGGPVHVFEGDVTNIKITGPGDFATAERFLLGPLETRIGFGYDVHATGPGDAVMLGGIRIPHDRALIGHSDADVVLHALTDAILGALADGDIGVHFPPSDPQWRGASSDRFARFALERLAARHGRLDHVDVCLLCEAPRIGPHRTAMIARLAEICGVAASRIGLKATTAEGLGFVGRREGIAAQVVATIRLPGSEP
jgi:2-C-methyl-D-erythritol 4-phosphate cytidylyltransferase/2-C-methyl-D-erythritol 2,4-cyclodiphosphate synthase